MAGLLLLLHDIFDNFSDHPLPVRAGRKYAMIGKKLLWIFFFFFKLSFLFRCRFLLVNTFHRGSSGNNCDL